MNRRSPRASVVVALLVVPLMVFVVPTGVVSAAPAPAISDAASQWAYAAVRNVSISGTTVSGWTYTLTARYGYAVTLSEPNPGANPFEVTVNRTMGANLSLVACKPSCSDPTLGQGSVSFRALESSDAFANFTTTGTVYENGTAVPALALVNSSSASSANLSERASLKEAVGPVDWSTFFAAQTHSAAVVKFSTPLGLIPLNLTAAQNWNSSSAFLAVGESTWKWYFGYDSLRTGPGSAGSSGPATVAAVGNVSVIGSYGGSTIPFGGVSYPVLSLEVIGPFSVREGFILLPVGGDIFSTTAQPWQADQSSATTVQLGTLDGRPLAGGHLGLVASSWVYQASSTNPGDATSPSAASVAGVTPALTGAAGPALPATTVQGSPTSVSGAQQVTGCLETGLGCPSTGGGATSPFHLLGGVLLFGIVAVVIAAVVGTVLVAERRRVPATVYPNANLYPPGASGVPPATRGGPESPARPAPPSEDDPLSHLW